MAPRFDAPLERLERDLSGFSGNRAFARGQRRTSPASLGVPLSGNTDAMNVQKRQRKRVAPKRVATKAPSTSAALRETLRGIAKPGEAEKFVRRLREEWD